MVVFQSSFDCEFISYSQCHLHVSAFGSDFHIGKFSHIKPLLYLRNKFNFWSVHEIMNTSVSFKRNVKPEFITFTYILYYQLSITLQFSPNFG